MSYREIAKIRYAVKLSYCVLGLLSLQLVVPRTANGLNPPNSYADEVSIFAITLQFSNQVVDKPTAPQLITLLDNGGSAAVPIPIASIAVNEGQVDDFTLSNGCGSSIAFGASCQLSVIFSPVSIGAKSATATVTYGDGSTQRVHLSGTGTLVPGQVTFSATSLNFGDIPAATGTQTGFQAITVTNGTSSVVAFPSAVITGGQADDFTVDGCTSSLAPGTTCLIDVSFYPLELARVFQTGR